MARKPVKVYPRGNYYYYQLLKEDGEYDTARSTSISVSRPIKIVEQEVIAAITKGNLSRNKDKTISNTTILRQIKKYIYSQYMLGQDQEINTNDLLNLLSQRLNGVSLKKDNPIFVEYLLNFWDWEKSEYIKNQLSGGFNVGKTYVRANLAKVKNHVVPFFDPNIRLQDIDTGLLEDFKKNLLARKVVSETGEKEKGNRPLL